jgi:four helix bundle protein
MGARNPEELVCWQLAVEFRDWVIAVLARPVFKRRFKYCNQLEDAVESIPSNIAEGFYRYTHPEIARFFGIALGSLGEAQTRLGSARAQNLIAADEYQYFRNLAKRTRSAIGKFINYLRATDAPPPGKCNQGKAATRPHAPDAPVAPVAPVALSHRLLSRLR